jgi:hypothetical protein
MRRAVTDRGDGARHGLTLPVIAALAFAAANWAVASPGVPSPAAAVPSPSLVASPPSLAPSPAHRESLLAETATSRIYQVTLRTPSGHPARAMLRVPREPGPAPICGVVLVGGFRNGWRAAEFLDPGPGFALLSVDYPYEGRRMRIPFRDFVSRAADLWRATREMSGLILQAGDYLARRPGVDSTRVAIAGGSLGVPFALHAAARSPRFRAVAVLYGSADLGDWVARNLRGVPRWAARLVGAVVAVLYRDYEPARLIPLVHPRPVLLVNGRGDPRISEAGAVRLFEAALEPREQVWLEGAHIQLENEALLRRLLDVTLAWLRRIGFAEAERV